MFLAKVEGKVIGVKRETRTWNDRTTGQKRTFEVCAISMSADGSCCVLTVPDVDGMREKAMALKEDQPVKLALSSVEDDKGCVRGQVASIG